MICTPIMQALMAFIAMFSTVFKTYEKPHDLKKDRWTLVAERLKVEICIKQFFEHQWN